MNPTEKLNPEVAHYQHFAIQPIDFIVANKLDFLEGNIIKYVSRYKHKNGIEDLRKAKNYLDWLIEREEEMPTKVIQCDGVSVAHLNPEIFKLPFYQTSDEVIKAMREWSEKSEKRNIEDEKYQPSGLE